MLRAAGVQTTLNLTATLPRVAFEYAQAAGVQVRRSTRCAAGPVIGGALLRSAGVLSPVQARVELLLELLA